MATARDWGLWITDEDLQFLGLRQVACAGQERFEAALVVDDRVHSSAGHQFAQRVGSEGWAEL